MRMKGYRFLSQVSSFTGRAVVFCFLLSALLFFFYMLGNYQGFLDSTQVLLLSLLRISLTFELVTGAWLAILLVCRAITERRLLIVRWVLLILSLVLCGALLAALRMVQQWLQA
jgi:hypothetical protein